MSAAIKFGDVTVWGTNGAIKFVVEELIAEASSCNAVRSKKEFSVWLAGVGDSWFGGMVVDLESFSSDRENLKTLHQCCESVFRRLDDDADWTPVGKKWIREQNARFGEILHCIETKAQQDGGRKG